jgi:hypothetical protein
MALITLTAAQQLSIRAILGLQEAPGKSETGEFIADLAEKICPVDVWNRLTKVAPDGRLSIEPGVGSCPPVETDLDKREVRQLWEIVLAAPISVNDRLSWYRPLMRTLASAVEG